MVLVNGKTWSRRSSRGSWIPALLGAWGVPWWSVSETSCSFPHVLSPRFVVGDGYSGVQAGSLTQWLRKAWSPMPVCPSNPRALGGLELFQSLGIPGLVRILTEKHLHIFPEELESLVRRSRLWE